MCNFDISADERACHDSYAGCKLNAKATVQEYYSGSGPTLDTVALKYAKGEYGSSGYTWQAGMSGCLAALTDEYQRAHG
jgi:hypothetical protein